MRRRLAAALIAPMFLLAACGGSGSASPSTAAASASGSPTAEATASAADIAALAAVTLTGAVGSQPTVNLTAPFTVTAPVARVETKGTGASLNVGESLQINFVAVGGADGKVSGTSYTANPETITLGDSSIVTAMNKVLTGQNVGVRVLLAVPGTSATTVMAIEVVSAKAIPTKASGTAVAPVAGLPTVTLASNGEPTVTIPKTTAPAALVAQPLIKGTGAAVTSGQSITVQYTGWTWDGTKFDSSWTGTAPFSTAIGTGAVVKGWDQGLVGQTVGSQVLLVIPPDLGYGTTAQGTIPANSTLVFVVDILAAS